jgi:hypothetical protein
VLGSSERIIFINQGKNWGRDIPLAEVKMDSESVFKIRNTFVTKKKGGEDFGRVRIANSVCLATRIRADTLRAFAKQFGGEGGEEMNVSAYCSRPVLHIQDATGNQRPSVLMFEDAVTRYGGSVKDGFLGEAFRRGGNCSKGQMEQQFVVLKEEESECQYQQGVE